MSSNYPQLVEGNLGQMGFYRIPGYSRYVTDNQGQVLNLDRMEFLEGSRNPDGYHNFRLVDDEGKTLTWGRHRLLAYVFKRPERDIRDLVVNHINAVKGDDDLANLEWTTYQGNAEHAGALGLTDYCIPIEVRDADTGVVTKFPSLIKCAKAYGLSKDAVCYRIKIGHARVFPERKQYRLQNTDEPWFIPENVETSLLQNGRSKRACLKYVLSGQELCFDQLTQLAEHLGIPVSTLSQWINFPGQLVLPGFIQLKWERDNVPWRPVADPYLEHDRFAGTRSVKVTHELSGKTTMYVSAAECARAMGLKPTALNHRLKSDGQKVFSDGFRYCYYSKSVSINGPIDSK